MAKKGTDARETSEERMQRCRDLYMRETRRWQDFHDAQTDELNFSLKLRHYHDDSGNKDQPQRVKPKGLQVYSAIRRKAAEISSKEQYLDIRPTDNPMAPALADVVRAVIEGEVHDPLKRYAFVEDNVALGALAARMWYARLDWCPEIGRFGEIMPVLGDGRRLMWAAGYESPHLPTCPWVMELVPTPVSEIEAQSNWKDTDDVVADSEAEEEKFRSGTTSGTVGTDPEDDTVLVMYLWERNKPSSRVADKQGSAKTLKPEEQFMVCGEMDGPGCGFKGVPGPGQPEYAAGACPDCAEQRQIDPQYPYPGDLWRVDVVAAEYEFKAEHTLTIFAPNQLREFYSGPWPFNTRSVPYLVFRAYLDPTEPMGQSETSLNYTLQLADDLVMRLGLEHMMLAKPYYVLPEGEVNDSSGNPWEFGQLQGLGIYYNSLNAQPGLMQVLQANGLPPAWATLHGSLDNQLRQDMGTNEMPMSADRTRDIPVGSLEIMERVAEIPVQHQIECFQRELTVWRGVLLDMIRETYTEDRMVSMRGEQGRWELQALRGDLIPNANVIVTADPSAARIDAERLQSLSTIANSPRWQWDFYAKHLNIPATEIHQLEEAYDVFAQQQADAMASMGAGAPGAIPGAPGKRPGMNPAPQMGGI